MSKTPQRQLTDKILNRIQSSNLKIYDQDQGKSISEVKKNKISCNSCLKVQHKVIPLKELQKDASLLNDTFVKGKYQQGRIEKTLTYNQLEMISIKSDKQSEDLRLMHSQIVSSQLNILRKKEEYQNSQRTMLKTLENNLRNNLIQLTNLKIPQLDKIIQQHQEMVSQVVSQQQDQFLNDQYTSIQDHLQFQQNQQEQLIRQLKSKVIYQNLLFTKLQQSVNEPLLGMAGLLQTVGSLKGQIDLLNDQINQKDKEISQQQYQLNKIHSHLDKLKELLIKYPTMFREETTYSVINIKELQYDLESLYLKYSQFKASDQIIKQKQDDYDELFKKLNEERAQFENQLRETSNLKDPKLRTLIQDLSRLILSKDPDGMTKELRDLIRDIFVLNHRDIIEEKDNQIQLLKDQVARFGQDSDFRGSFGGQVDILKIPLFDEIEYQYLSQSTRNMPVQDQMILQISSNSIL
ncbi:hypothetical protein pb186bvf_019262 [Paramecium bursaria]